MEKNIKDKPRLVVDYKRLIIFGIFMLIVWFSIWALLYLKADEITKDPCSVCAKQHGEDVFCTVGNLYPVTRTYLPNGTVIDNEKEVEKEVRKDYNIKCRDEYEFNFSLLQNVTS